MSYSNSEKFKKQKQKQTLAQIEKNEHLYVSGEYSTKESELVVFCKKHNFTQVTSFNNYLRSRNGTPCCGKQKVSKKLTGRIYSPETIELMRESARTRIRRTGTAQYWRRTPEYRKWERAVRSNWEGKCVITGRLNNIVIHHFYSGTRSLLNFDYFLLQNQNRSFALRFAPENGILLYKDIHVDFHKRYGFENTTLKQFCSYIDQIIMDMSISNQAYQTYKEWWEGPETKARRIARLKRLKKRLEKVQSILDKIEYDIE